MLFIKRYARSNPIATKLLAYVLLSSSFITFIAIGFQLYTHFNQDMDDLDKRLKQIQVSSIPSISKSLWAFDTSQLNTQIEGILKLKDIEQVTVNWKDWDQKIQSLTSKTASFESHKSQSMLRNKVVTFQLEYQENSNSDVQVLGNIEIIASLEGIYQRLGEQAILIGFQQGTKTILISLIILWLVRLLITRHLEEIALYARQSSLSNLDKSLTLKRKLSSKEDELDNVVNGFNQMRLSLLNDIDRRKETELALEKETLAKAASEQRQRDAEEANRAKSQFLATMSHEIRTPMNGVIGLVDILLNTKLDDSQRNYLTTLQRSGESLLSLINDILDYSKIEANRMEIEATPLDLNILIADCIQLFAPIAGKKNLMFTGGVQPNTPTQIIGDPTRIKQILVNLLGNAFKFTDQGHIILNVETLTTIDQNTMALKFSVTDSGIGIASQQAEELFCPFTQADSTTTRKYGGTGLGLTISKLLCELMGGDIGATSNEIGSTFWFSAQFSLQPSQAQQTLPSSTKKTLILYNHTVFCEFFNAFNAQYNLMAKRVDFSKETLSHVLNNCHHDYDWIVVDIETLTTQSNAAELVIFNQQHPKIVPLFSINENSNPTLINAHHWPHKLTKPISPYYLALRILEWENNLTEQSPAPDKNSNALNNNIAVKRVLVAEDNPVNQLVIEGLLGKLNITCNVKDNGLKALEHFKHHSNYDAILMDCEMPIMDGLKCTEQIRRYEAENNLPAITIVALTAHALEDHREMALAAGMDLFLTKPVTLNSLIATLEAIKPNNPSNRH